MAKEPRRNAQQATKKWVTNTSAATEEMKIGIEAVTEAPGAKAAAAVQKYVRGVQENAQKFATNVGAVTLQSWKEKAINLGLPRVATGVQEKQGKMEAFLNEFLPHLAAGMARVNAMPSETYEQRKAKATAMMDYNHQFKRAPSQG